MYLPPRHVPWVSLPSRRRLLPPTIAASGAAGGPPCRAARGHGHPPAAGHLLPGHPECGAAGSGAVRWGMVGESGPAASRGDPPALCGSGTACPESGPSSGPRRHTLASDLDGRTDGSRAPGIATAPRPEGIPGGSDGGARRSGALSHRPRVHRATDARCGIGPLGAHARHVSRVTHPPVESGRLLRRADRTR